MSKVVRVTWVLVHEQSLPSSLVCSCSWLPVADCSWTKFLIRLWKTCTCHLTVFCHHMGHQALCCSLSSSILLPASGPLHTSSPPSALTHLPVWILLHSVSGSNSIWKFLYSYPCLPQARSGCSVLFLAWFLAWHLSQFMCVFLNILVSVYFPY